MILKIAIGGLHIIGSLISWEDMGVSCAGRRATEPVDFLIGSRQSLEMRSKSH